MKYRSNTTARALEGWGGHSDGKSCSCFSASTGIGSCAGACICYTSSPTSVLDLKRLSLGGDLDLLRLRTGRGLGALTRRGSCLARSFAGGNRSSVRCFLGDGPRLPCSWYHLEGDLYGARAQIACDSLRCVGGSNIMEMAGERGKTWGEG